MLTKVLFRDEATPVILPVLSRKAIIFHLALPKVKASVPKNENFTPLRPSFEEKNYIGPGASLRLRPG